MTSFRVTERAIASSVLFGLQSNLDRLGKTQEKLSSGKNITRPSDNPGGAVQSMQYRSDVATTQQHQRNADDGLGWLGTADNALTSILQQTGRARELTLQGMSTGGNATPEARLALAAEIDNIRAASIGLANTTYEDRPVFGGTTAGSTAYDTSGAYVGDSGTIQRTVADNTKIRVDIGGEQAFGTGSTQLFTVLDDISNALRNDPSLLSDALDRLDTVVTGVQGGLSTVGARYNQVEQMRQTADDRVLNLTTQLSDVEDIDLPKTITDLQLQQTSYQVALAAAAKVVQPSLIDFLR
jgi:flagellar hook-associated protein 3 FlgL